jgi:hypothetical protein
MTWGKINEHGIHICNNIGDFIGNIKGNKILNPKNLQCPLSPAPNLLKEKKNVFYSYSLTYMIFINVANTPFA